MAWILWPIGELVKLGYEETEYEKEPRSASAGPRLRQPKEACKPSSVSEMPLVYAPTNRSFVPMAGPAATIYLDPSLPAGSSGQPGDRPDSRSPYLALLRMGFALPLMSPPER